METMLDVKGRMLRVVQTPATHDSLPSYRLFGTQNVIYETHRHGSDKHLMYLTSNKSSSSYDIWLTDAGGELAFSHGKWGK